jgi:acetylglutamate kinase
VIRDLVLLSCVGLHPVLIYGGRIEINLWLLRVSIKPQFRNSICVTDVLTMEVVEMVLVGKVNNHLVSFFNLGGGTVIGLCGKDACFITNHPSPNIV